MCYRDYEKMKCSLLPYTLHSSPSRPVLFFRKRGRNRAITFKATNLVSNIPRWRAPGIKVMGEGGEKYRDCSLCCSHLLPNRSPPPE